MANDDHRTRLEIDFRGASRAKSKQHTGLLSVTLPGNHKASQQNKRRRHIHCPFPVESFDRLPLRLIRCSENAYIFLMEKRDRQI